MALVERIVLCLFLLAEILVSAQLEIGDPCGPKNERVCIAAEHCKEAVTAIKDKKMHGLERCGWRGFDEIVCCTRPDIDKQILRRSTQECIKYWNLAEKDTGPYIINGYNVTLGEFPHMAALGFDKSGDGTISWGDCGGSLISKNFVLTAAHCVVRSDRRKPAMVRLGKVDLFGNEDNVEPQDIRVIEDIVHSDYSHFKKLNDIALLRLEKDAEMNDNVKPICLHAEEVLSSKTGLVIAGWGKTNKTGVTSRFLLQASVDPVDLSSCNETFFQQSQIALSNSHICASSPHEYPTDTCQGDSGGPLQIVNRKNDQKSPLIIVGVTSFGRGCGGPIPSVYTRVFEFLDWIESIVWP